MTIAFATIGIVFFIGIGYRFATRMTAKEPVVYRAK
jgi:hypothetical protein